MAQRRTRAQKIATARKRAEGTSSIFFDKDRVAQTLPEADRPGVVKRQTEIEPEREKFQPPQAELGEKGLSSLLSYNRAYIRRDLTKTAILATLALGLELVLYFGLEKGRLALPF